MVLYDGELSPGTHGHADASVSERGDVVMSAQDVGAGPSEFWGDSDYEWWVTVKAAQVAKLLRHLREEMPSSGDEDVLSLIGIPYEFFSYA